MLGMAKPNWGHLLVTELRKQKPECFPSPELQKMQGLVGFRRMLKFTYSQWPLGAVGPSPPFTWLLRKDELKWHWVVLEMTFNPRSTTAHPWHLWPGAAAVCRGQLPSSTPQAALQRDQHKILRCASAAESIPPKKTPTLFNKNILQLS